MAYRSKGKSKGRARRGGYNSRKFSGASSKRGKSSRRMGGRSSGQTVRLVIEQVPASQSPQIVDSVFGKPVPLRKRMF